MGTFIEPQCNPTDRRKQDQRLKQFINRAYRRCGYGFWEIRTAKGARVFYGPHSRISIDLGHYLVDLKTGYILQHGPGTPPWPTTYRSSGSNETDWPGLVHG